MASFNSHIVVFLISLCIAVIISGATAKTNAAPAPVSKDEQAKDIQYLTSQMTAAVDKVQKFNIDPVTKMMNDSTTNKSTKECLSVCEEVYESAVEALQKGIKSLATGDFYTVNIAVSAYLTDITTCDDCFSDEVVPEFLQKFDVWAKSVGLDILERIAKYST